MPMTDAVPILLPHLLARQDDDGWMPLVGIGVFLAIWLFAAVASAMKKKGEGQPHVKDPRFAAPPAGNRSRVSAPPPPLPPAVKAKTKKGKRKAVPPPPPLPAQPTRLRQAPPPVPNPAPRSPVGRAGRAVGLTRWGPGGGPHP